MNPCQRRLDSSYRSVRIRPSGEKSELKNPDECVRRHVNHLRSRKEGAAQEPCPFSW
jgi:hypothetical protein